MAKNNYHQFQQNYDQTYSRSEESELKVLVGIILILKMQNILLKNHNFFKGHILSSLRRKKLASQFSDRPPERYKTTSTCLPLPPPSLSAFLYIYICTKNQLNGIKACVLLEKHIKNKYLCCLDKNYYYFCKSNIPGISLIVRFRNTIEVSKNTNS